MKRINGMDFTDYEIEIAEKLYNQLEENEKEDTFILEELLFTSYVFDIDRCEILAKYAFGEFSVK